MRTAGRKRAPSRERPQSGQLRRGCHSNTAGVVVLDNGNSRLVEVVSGTQSGVSINVVVVAHRLTVQLLRLSNTGGSGGVNVQGGTLVRVLAVTQGLAALKAQASVRGQKLASSSCRNWDAVQVATAVSYAAVWANAPAARRRRSSREKPPFLAASTVRA